MKKEITMPKGYKCKNGVCLEQDAVFDLEIPEATPTIIDIPEIQVSGTVQSSKPVSIPEIKEVVKEVVKETKVVPSWQPNYVCKGPNCNTKKNPAYQTRPKGICSNCGQFTKESFGTCIWCNSKEIEELESDKLDELGIPTPESNIEDTEEAD